MRYFYEHSKFNEKYRVAATNIATASALLNLAATQLDSQKVCLNMTPTNGYSSSNYCLPQITNIRLVKPFANIASSALKGNEAIGAPLTNITSLGLVVTSAIFFRNAIKHTKEFMDQVSKY